VPEVNKLFQAIQDGLTLITTGLVFQELLQGFSGAKAQDQIIARFTSLPILVPQRADHIEAANLRNRCRHVGVQVGTIDALLAALCVRHDLTMLTTDRDFTNIAKNSRLRVWAEKL